MREEEWELVFNGSRVSAWEDKKKKSSRTRFPGGSVVKNLPANAGHVGSIPGPGRSRVPRGS